VDVELDRALAGISSLAGHNTQARGRGKRDLASASAARRLGAGRCAGVDAGMRTETPQPIRLADYRPPAYLVDEVLLTFDLEPNATRVKARLSVRRNGDHAEPLQFNGERLKAVSVAVDGKRLGPGEHTIDEEFLTIPDVPEAFTLETEVEIDPEANKALDGLYMSGGRFCTQCEAEGFRKITYWPDRPDVLSRFTVRIEADKADYPRLLSNGNLVEAGDLEGGRHFAVWNDPFPKPCYLFALVAGALDV